MEITSYRKIENVTYEGKPSLPQETNIKTAADQSSTHSLESPKGTNIVIIDDDLQEAFPDSETINKVLRDYAREHKLIIE
jgi:uncharacterized protein (DUF4415 family)